VTTVLPRLALKPRAAWQPTDDYDDRARWLDDKDGGDRWRAYRACADIDSNLFFPEDQNGDEPPYPPPDVKKICERCPVAGRCLATFMDEDYGIYAGTTGYQRSLLTKKTRRKQCPSCTSTDVVINGNLKNELCLGCGISWDVL
jgi:hypothetical protein